MDQQEQLQKIADDLSAIKAYLLNTQTVFKPDEAAKYMGIALSTVYKLTSAGILPYSKPNGKNVYFSRAALDEWMLSNKSIGHEQKQIEASTYVTTHK